MIPVLPTPSDSARHTALCVPAGKQAGRGEGRALEAAHQAFTPHQTTGIGRGGVGWGRLRRVFQRNPAFTPGVAKPLSPAVLFAAIRRAIAGWKLQGRGRLDGSVPQQRCQPVRFTGYARHSACNLRIIGIKIGARDRQRAKSLSGQRASSCRPQNNWSARPGNCDCQTRGRPSTGRRSVQTQNGSWAEARGTRSRARGAGRTASYRCRMPSGRGSPSGTKPQPVWRDEP